MRFQFLAAEGNPKLATDEALPRAFISNLVDRRARDLIFEDWLKRSKKQRRPAYADVFTWEELLYDSLDRVELVMSLEDQFKIVLHDDDTDRAASPAQLAGLVARTVAENGSRSFSPAAQGDGAGYQAVDARRGASRAVAASAATSAAVQSTEVATSRSRRRGVRTLLIVLVVAGIVLLAPFLALVTGVLFGAVAVLFAIVTGG